MSAYQYPIYPLVPYILYMVYQYIHIRVRAWALMPLVFLEPWAHGQATFELSLPSCGGEHVVRWDTWRTCAKFHGGSPEPIGPFKGMNRAKYNEHTGNKSKSICGTIWELGGFGSAQNTPTRSGNHFHTRQTHSGEFICSMIFD